MADEDDAIENVPELLGYRAKHDADRLTFQFYDRHGFVGNLTPREIYHKAGKFAHLLRSWGFQKGEVVANGLPNSPERVISDFGVILSGCVLANCQVIEKDGGDFWHTARISHCRGVILPARPATAPHRIFSKFIPTTTEDTTTPPSETSSRDETDLKIIHDVIIPQAPTIRKLIICNRKSKLGGGANVQGKKEEGEEERKDERQENQQNKVDQDQQKQQEVDQERLQTQSQNTAILTTFEALNNVKEFYQAECDLTDLALLLTTSGSTGFNKLVPATHEYILYMARMYQKQGRNNLTWNDRPFGWMGGFPFEFLGSGSCRVLLDLFDDQDTIGDPRDVWGFISHAKCQGVVMMPNDVIRLADAFQNAPPEHKALFIATGGQAVRKELARAIGVMCHGLVVSYGFSEGGVFTMAFVSKPDQFWDFYCGQKYKDNVQLKIADKHGEDLGTGQYGEIYVKCDQIIERYYDMETPSQPKLRTEDGWYRTGDRGMVDDNGSLFCIGRQGDVTSVNGVIVYLSWLESILNKSPDVLNSSVVAIGYDDGVVAKKDGGDGAGGNGGSSSSSSSSSGGGVDGNSAGDGVMFCGFVELKPDSSKTPDQLKDFFMENLMDTDYKDKLKLSHVFVVDSFPVIPSRKVNKRALIQMAKDKLGL